MDTPASPATTPSPHLSASSHSTLDATASSSSRKRALPDGEQSPNIDSFLKRAHYGKLARELRARLSYATFKTSHNVSHLPLTTLEQKFGAKPRISPTSIPLATASTSQPLSPKNRSSQSQMMPPPTASPRNPSLYAALLGSAPMPPSKRARQHAPHSHQGSQKHNPLSPQSMPLHGGRSIHNRHRSTGQINDHDDISAAATLTSLLLTRPASISEGGSSISRSSSSASVTAFTTSQPSQLSQPGSSSYRRQGVASSSSAASIGQSSSQGRPKTPQPDDAQAAELMLFLATSPSPRPSSTRSRSESRPGQLLSKARVLFGSSDSNSGMMPSPRGSATPTGPPATGVGHLGDALTPFLSSSAPSSSQLLPPPPSPHSKKDVFDIGEFINTSPFPPQSPFSRSVIAKGKGRSLFSDDEQSLGGPSMPPSRTGSMVGGMSGAGAVIGTGDGGMLGSVLGPPMDANVFQEPPSFSAR